MPTALGGPASLDPVHFAVLRASGLFQPEWYALAYQGHLPREADPLVHFCDRGWQEGRQPNPYFDPAWYLEQNPALRASGENPLLHYVLHGEREGRWPIAWFDPAWYRDAHQVPPEALCLRHFLDRRQSGEVSPIREFDPRYYLKTYQDVAEARVDPFEHYLFQGHKEGRNPSPGFDTRFYRERYLGGSDQENPLLHYLRHRDQPGVHPVRPAAETSIPREVRRNTSPGPLFEERRALPDSAPRRARLLAYYLPQFHAIPQNDAWWGAGFTEWANVQRGLPRFAGHYQPRIPRDLGPYTLEGTEVLRRQIAMAREAGLFAFVFYFYWFNGTRLLERPVESFLADRALDFPFCLMWANENWTRRWDGSEDQVLISQDYRDTDEPALLAEFGRHFADPRYIRVQGRPLLMVYRPRLIPATAETIERWRGAFRQRHAEDPIFVMAQSFTDCDPRPFGLDGAIEFPPHKLVRGLGLQQPEEVLDPDFTAQVYDYEQVAAASLAEPAPDYPLIKTAVPGWDNDARRQGAGLVLHGSTPARYQAWLEGLIRRAAQHRFFGESFVCINAWNEWAEGAYLEPDVHFGAAYLNATARAVAGLAQASEAGRLLLVGHDAFPAGAQLLLLHLGRQLRRAHGVEIAFLLLDGGELEPAYAEAGPLAITRDDAALAERAAALRAQGFRAAIVNSAASARACAALQRAGLDCTLLVHELPRLLQARGLAGPAAEAAAIARQVVFPAEIVRDGFAATTGRAPAASTILPQGIYRPAPFSEARRQELRAQLGVAPDAILALGVGYADLRKGFDLFLQLWHAARRADRIVHLCWIGRRDPLLDGHLAAEIEAAEASRTFHMPGYREDAAEWFSAADVHVLTSREDPFPSVVLEAMSAGVPSIAFEGSGGIPELLRRHDAGTVVPMGDVPGMATALLALAGGAVEPRRTRLTRLAREEFSFGRYAERLLHLARPDVPRISVAVPSHNYARFLRQRLASIFAQTHPVLEVIVLDDASTDDSVAVARAAAEEWGREIHIVESPANSGSVFRQWQRAVELARGDWLWIAEADDASEPGFLERLAGALTAAPGAVLGFTDSRAIDEAGQPVMESYKPYYRQCGGDLLAASGSFAGRDFLRACLATHNLILNASAVLWRRDALCAAFARCATDLGQFRMAGDWRLYAEALDAADAHVAYVAEPLNVHRRHSGSVTHRLDRDAHLDEIARMHALLAGRLGHDPGLRARQARVIEELADRPGHVVRPARSGEGIRLRVVA